VREKLFEKSLSRALFKKLSILIFICILTLRLYLQMPSPLGEGGKIFDFDG
jgi:hypothetical protein